MSEISIQLLSYVLLGLVCCIFAALIFVAVKTIRSDRRINKFRKTIKPGDEAEVGFINPTFLPTTIESVEDERVIVKIEVGTYNIYPKKETK